MWEGLAFLSLSSLPTNSLSFSTFSPSIRIIFVTTVGGATPRLVVLGDMKSGLKSFDDQDSK